MLSKISKSEKDKCNMISLTCESNKQTELTNKVKTDLYRENRMTAKGQALEGGGTKQRGKRTHGHGQHDCDCDGER